MKNLVHKETSAPALGIVISDTEAGAPIASRIDDNLDPPVALAIAESVLWIIVIWYVAAAAEESRCGAELEQCLSRARQSTDADALRQCPRCEGTSSFLAFSVWAFGRFGHFYYSYFSNHRTISLLNGFVKISSPQPIERVAEYVQSVAGSSVKVGIIVQCFFRKRKPAGDTYTDVDGITRLRFKTSKVPTFKYIYDFSPAVSSVDISPFGAEQARALQFTKCKTNYMGFESNLSVEESPDFKRFVKAWEDHLFAANQHRGGLRPPTLDDLTTIYPLVPFQMIRLPGSTGSPSLMTPTAYHLAVIFQVKYLYEKYFFANNVSLCNLAFRKRVSLSPEHQSFSPTPQGEESLPMQLPMSTAPD